SGGTTVGFASSASGTTAAGPAASALVWPATPVLPTARDVDGSGVALRPATTTPASGSVAVGARVGAAAWRGGPAATFGTLPPTRELGLPAGWMIRDQELSLPELPPQSMICSSQVPWAFSPAREDKAPSG